MTAAEREAWLDHLCQTGDPPDPDEEDEDVEPLTAEELAEVRAAAADEMLAAEAAMTGRRGPGMAGSARVFPGESSSPAASFGPGMVLDVMPGCAGLAVAADAAAGDDAQFRGVSDAELFGVVCGWDRVEAHAAARKLAAIAEVYRRRPEPGCGIDGPGRMPVACEEFAAAELAAALGESRARAADLLGSAWELAARLPGTVAALRDGVVTWAKAGIILRAAQFLDPAEAAAAEGKVLGRAGRADRPGEIAGIGPVDPWLARDLAAAAAANPKTTWCVTVTDQHGHAIGHGCARPEPGATGNAPDQGRRRAGPGSPSPRPAGTGRPAGTAAGGCAPRAAGRT